MLLLIGSNLPLIAQVIPHRHYTTKDGLPSNNCYRLIDDGQGMIWIATDKGVVRFDGYEFENIFEELNLKIKDIYNCFADSEDRIWIESKDQRKKYIHKNKLVWLDDPDKAPVKNEYALYYPNSGLFFTPHKRESDAFITIRDISGSISYKLPLLKHDKVMLLKEDSTHINVLTMYSGMYVLEKKTRKVHVKLRFAKGISVTSDNRGFYHPRYYGKEQYFFTTKDSVFMLRDRDVFPLFPINMLKGNKLIGFDNGWIILHDPTSGNFSKISIFGVFEDMDLPPIQGDGATLVVDRERNWWISSLYSGVFLIPAKSFKSRQYFQIDNAVKTPKITHIGPMHDKGLMLINDNLDHFHLYKDGVFTKVYRNLYAHLYNLLEDDFHQIISGNLTVYSKSPVLVEGDVNSPMKQGTIKAGSWYINRPSLTSDDDQIILSQGYYSPKFIARLENNTFLTGGCLALLKIQSRKNHIKIFDVVKPIECVYHIQKTRGGLVLLGTTEGVYEYKDGKMGQRWYGNYLKGYTRSIADDAYGNIWVSTDEGGIYLVNPKSRKVKLIPEFKNVIANQFYYQEENHSMWIASSKGLWRAQYSGHDTYKFRRYSFTDGLQSLDINTVYCQNDTIYAGSSDGLTIIHDAENESHHIPRLRCTQIKINGIDKPLQDAYSLPYFENSINIQLTNLCYASMGDNTYNYKLTGPGNPTSISTKDRNINFYNLSPGRYRFNARAFNVDGVPSENEVNLVFDIHPAFYNTIWFRLCFILLAISLPLILFVRRNRKKLEANKKEYEFQKKMAEIKLESLQSQLNSHFIFNSLNAIQNYIFLNDEVSANEYLNMFSRLIRGYLEASKKQYIGLMDEIELLRLYLSLESLRSGDKFEYTISLESQFDNTWQIPSNIIQPFVENAIEHGLKNKDGKGSLNIRLSKEGDQLICQITDDGIGREKSLAMKKNNLKKQSLGLKIIEERIAAIKEFDHTDITIQTQDLHADQSDKGTTVTIRMTVQALKP
ncbi:MAG: histidine kinase [Saprospiraceae bacterium]|nr:histidine kinase [Saprospiraceae bacterium]